MCVESVFTFFGAFCERTAKRDERLDAEKKRPWRSKRSEKPGIEDSRERRRERKALRAGLMPWRKP
jgi:hypothetical protein